MKHSANRAAVIAHIQADLDAKHPQFRVQNLQVGPRVNKGVYSYYKYSFFCLARHRGMLSGSSGGDWEYRFDNDDEDAALRSASL